MPERLDKFLSSQNLGSRKDVTLLVRSGRVQVNGETVRDAAQKIEPEADSVTVDGTEVAYRKHLYLMMNKPAGVLSATEDSRAQTVLDLLPPELYRRGLFPAGRLDKDTTGLLIITDDGDFAHKMLAPKSHVYKLYEAETLRPVTEEDAEAFAAGITQGGQTFAPARLWTKMRQGREVALVEIREGKFHQVKRMFQAVGNQVVSLKRLKIGGLSLDETLPAGGARLLTEEEIGSIFMANCT
ncbi:MAG: rRNA pseudouridine synthase [Acutalibacter sp.]|nr:rRNA pseudouridine synthase [Acutalibacter sp.]